MTKLAILLMSLLFFAHEPAFSETMHAGQPFHRIFKEKYGDKLVPGSTWARLSLAEEVARKELRNRIGANWTDVGSKLPWTFGGFERGLSFDQAKALVGKTIGILYHSYEGYTVCVGKILRVSSFDDYNDDMAVGHVEINGVEKEIHLSLLFDLYVAGDHDL